jgi:uncharacterized iron-regulated membrane protein
MMTRGEEPSMSVRTYRKIHRWLGIVVGLQLLLWTAGGLFFSLNPIAKVRGETEKPAPPALDATAPAVSPEQALIDLMAHHPQAEVRTVTLRPHVEGAVYEIAYMERGESRWALADAATGELRGPVDREEALEIAARAYLPGSPVAEVSLVTEAAPGSEYRERPLPAYRVNFDDPLGTRLYVSVERGVVTARRNDRWRLFDLLWMLHIMDYQTRDNFNSLLLQVASGLGLVTVLSGFALFAVTSPLLRRWFPTRKQA